MLAGFTYSEANSLSEADSAGVIWVVGVSYDTSANAHPTVWRVNAAGTVLAPAIDLEPSAGGRANDVVVTNSGVQVVGQAYVTSSAYHAFVWQLDFQGQFVARTDLGTLGGTVSSAFAINRDGHVAGRARTTTTYDHAFLYRNGPLADLGSLTNGGSTAYGLNDGDVVVGGASSFSRTGVYLRDYAFVWQNGTMYDLKSLLPPKTTWKYLFDAFDVNAAGQIVGGGNVGKVAPGEAHGFLARPNTPALMANALGAAEGVSSLTSKQVRPLFTEALARWQTAGVAVFALRGIDIRIANLGGNYLGMTDGHTIWLDDNAAGWGWFVDRTPWNDSEFTTPGNQGEQHRMDLLTVLEHEIGHLLGKEHEADGVMRDTLAGGVRRMPQAARPFIDAAIVEWVLAHKN